MVQVTEYNQWSRNLTSSVLFVLINAAAELNKINIEADANPHMWKMLSLAHMNSMNEMRQKRQK